MKMKKLKKLVAGILSAAMVMSTMAVTAFAAPTIDTSVRSTGTLTINKYEGDTQDSNKLLNGVEFTMYKLADITQTVTNGVVDTKVTPTQDAVDAGLTAEKLASVANGSGSTAEWQDLLTKLTFSELEEYGSQITGQNGNQKGQVKFQNVPLGVYAVAETDAPSQVVSRSANFIVSIPMSVDEDNDNKVDSWQYDVTANPKNTTVYGGISLRKQGKTGNNESLVDLNGVTFELQRNENGSWKKVGEDLTTANGIISAQNLEPAVYRFVEKSLGEDNGGYILDGKKTYEFEIRIVEGQTHIYYDADNDGDKENQGTTGTGYTINALNEKPTLEKTVKDGETDGNPNWDNETDASIGDTVTWKVSASVPSRVNELKVFALKDQMSSALTWVSEADAALTITTTPAVTLTKDTDYELKVPNDNTAGGIWEITFKDAGKTKLAESNVTTIDVTFNTVLNSSASVGNVGNLNTGELDYSNAIYPTTAEDPDNPNRDKNPGEDVITDQASVYTFGLNVEKVDGSDTSTKLEGVTFDLYKYNGTKDSGVTEADLKGGDGEKIAVAQRDAVGKYVVEKSGTAELTTDTNGNINVAGLENGVYYLVETKTNKDYNLLKEPVKVQINVALTTTTSTTTYTDDDGNTTITTTVKTQEFTDGGDNTGTYKIQIQNNKGFELPTTGGMGTLLASFAGILLMAGGAFVFLSSRKRKNA